jgi:hypothetical protein
MPALQSSLDVIGTSIHDLATERKMRRLQVEARHETQLAAQARVLSSSPQRRHEAMQCMQQTESYLDPDRMIALIDLVSSDTIAADVYLSLQREDYRRHWISKRLADLGFVDGVAVGQ